ncbi:MAG: hypothetical protein Q8L14_13555 [Myxococcales bacterium]|nr:hypothetical protein [Myxococcales bacterium]
MTLDAELVAKGKGEPLEGVKAQGREHLTLIDKHPELKDFGWEDAGTTQLAKDVEFISTTEAARSEASDSSAIDTLTQEARIDDSKKLVRSIRNVLPAALRKAKKDGVVIDKKLLASGRLGRVVPAIVSYLTTVEPTVKRIDKYLQPYLKVVPSTRINEVRKALEAADTKQEASLGATTEYTAKLNEAKGRVVEAIEELNGIAKNAFDGNAAVIGKFSKDLLLRARRERAAKEDPTKK